MGKSCVISLTPDVDLVNPKIYYELNNFYSNHRNFVKSMSFEQLRGNILASDEVGDCSPVETMEELAITDQSIGEVLMSGSDVANPCGLIAKYVFNDTYAFDSTSGLTIDQSGIAHKVDIEYKFIAPDGQSSIAWYDVTDGKYNKFLGVKRDLLTFFFVEHMMVWY